MEEVVNEAGFGPIKAKQQEALEAFVSGRGTFVALSTGSDKSIIYAISPIVHDKIRGIYSKNCDNVMSILYRNRHCNCGVYISLLTAITVEQQRKFLILPVCTHSLPFQVSKVIIDLLQAVH